MSESSSGGRPLPDERPRQSVANLIGRFETHSKQLSVSQGSASRSSSVVSHITGDSAREEAKEKREWPPKAAAEKPSYSRVHPLAINSESATAKKDSADEPDAPLTAKALDASHSRVHQELNTYLENWRKDLPKTTEREPEAEPERATPKPTDVSLADPPAPAPASPHSPAPSQKVPAPKTPRTSATKAPVAKLPPSTSSKSSLASTKSPAKTLQKTVGSKQTLSPTAQPLKPQHTGQSTISTASAVARRTASKTPTTPKTPPARTESLSKTPTPSRSSGLFAPTAASLAKSRNAPPMPPPPVKKTTLSSDAMERLSKPTAASLSKAKSVSPTAPAVSLLKTPPRITVVKSKLPVATSTIKTSVKGKKEPARPSTSSEGAMADTLSSTTIASAASEVQEPLPETVAESNGHVNEPNVEAEDSATAPEESHATGDDDDDDDEPEKVEMAVVHSVISASPTLAPVNDSEVRQENTNGIQAVHPKVVGTELEDMVNLLETMPVARPSSEEISEIPDEAEPT